MKSARKTPPKDMKFELQVLHSHGDLRVPSQSFLGCFELMLGGLHRSGQNSQSIPVFRRREPLPGFGTNRGPLHLREKLGSGL